MDDFFAVVGDLKGFAVAMYDTIGEAASDGRLSQPFERVHLLGSSAATQEGLAHAISAHRRIALRASA